MLTRCELALDDMTKIQRSVFYLCMVPVLLGLYYLSNGLHDLVRWVVTELPEALLWNTIAHIRRGIVLNCTVAKMTRLRQMQLSEQLGS